ncbi:MAG: replicative DNA helicase [Clostridia bacterium]|nr:replicative DNA helicase [Clostridia bacterium]MBO4429519.1 replicative DNA helicase [Clostridia bacterium]
MADIERTMPFALEAEQSVLGAILLNPEKINQVAEYLQESDFYLSEHREIFAAMRDLFIQSRQIDIVTLIDMLVSRGTYDKENGSKYIRVIADTVPASANLGDYMKIVKEKATLRALIEAADEIREEAYAAKGEVKYIVDNAESKIYNVANGNEVKNFVTIADAITRTYYHIRDIANDPASAAGTPTSYSSLDNVLVGMGKGDLILIGARPGMGKTSFAMNIAANVAKSTKKTVCVFSLEMTCEQLAARLLSSEAMVDSKKIRSGKLSTEDWSEVSRAASELSELKMLIDDTTGITVTSMKAKLRKVKDLGLVVVDYLQLIQGERHADNRVLEVGDISRGLKMLAKDLGVPVICCAQLSRANEGRSDKRPMLSDLRDSGAIEQDADVVMFLHSEDYYKNENKPQTEAECIVAKNRHGETKTVKLIFLGTYTKFIEVDNTHEEPK